MNAVTGEPRLELEHVEREVISRDRELGNAFTQGPAGDRACASSRGYLPDHFIRGGAAPLSDPEGGPLIAVRLYVLTRKTLGGLQTDLDARVLNSAGEAIPRPVRGR